MSEDLFRKYPDAPSESLVELANEIAYMHIWKPWAVPQTKSNQLQKMRKQFPIAKLIATKLQTFLGAKK